MTSTVLTTAYDEAIGKYDALLRQAPKLDGIVADPKAMKAAAKAKDPKLDAPKLDMITRPNGEGYLPRKLKVGSSMSTDVQIIQRAYDEKLPALLYGVPGTGKTSLVEAALPGLVTLVGSAETEVSDFIGSWVQRTDGMYAWVDGPLAIAAEKGLPFLIDEIALIDPRAMSSVVYPVMDGRDEIHVTANPSRGTIKVHPGFVVYGACNPNVPGAIMSDALLSRFSIHVEMTTDWSLAEQLGVDPRIIMVARNLETKAENAEVMAAPQMREVLNFQKLVGVFGEEMALRNFVAQARLEDRTFYIEAIQSTFGIKIRGLVF